MGRGCSSRSASSIYNELQIYVVILQTCNRSKSFAYHVIVLQFLQYVTLAGVMALFCCNKLTTLENHSLVTVFHIKIAHINYWNTMFRIMIIAQKGSIIEILYNFTNSIDTYYHVIMLYFIVTVIKCFNLRLLPSHHRYNGIHFEGFQLDKFLASLAASG